MNQASKPATTKRELTTAALTALGMAGAGGGFAAEPPVAGKAGSPAGSTEPMPPVPERPKLVLISPVDRHVFQRQANECGLIHWPFEAPRSRRPRFRNGCRGMEKAIPVSPYSSSNTRVWRPGLVLSVRAACGPCSGIKGSMIDSTARQTNSIATCYPKFQQGGSGGARGTLV